MKYAASIIVAVFTLAGPALTLWADVFVLTNGSRITGKQINHEDAARKDKQYVIQTDDETQITLAADQVRQVLRPRPEESEYEKIQPTYPDTVEGQWALAEWCLERRLTQLRETHLQRVIELDPNHVKARHALGYSQVNGKWALREEAMTQQGYEYYKGRWRTRQEIERLEKDQKTKTEQKDWFQKIKLWHSWLGTDREQQAIENLHDVSDPAAVKALAMWLRDDPSVPNRLLAIEVLAKIASYDAMMALAAAAVDADAEEVRLTCLDRLVEKPPTGLVNYFIGRLKDKKKDNLKINLAAIALGRLKDPSCAGALVDALVTKHKFLIAKPGGENAMSASFGGQNGAPGGTGLSAGNTPKYENRYIQNPAVYDALRSLTSQDFGYDQQAWNAWLASLKKRETFDARRGP